VPAPIDRQRRVLLALRDAALAAADTTGRT
jgi:hypothetical protein